MMQVCGDVRTFSLMDPTVGFVLETTMCLNAKNCERVARGNDNGGTVLSPKNGF